MNKLNQVSYRNTITLKGGWLLVKNPCLILPWIKIFIVVDHGILQYSNIEIDMKTNNSHFDPHSEHNNQHDTHDHPGKRDYHNDNSGSKVKAEDNKVSFLT